ncbi:MAG: peptidase [Peptococcaceae bacterium BRH_c4b]|nr:MAG: peptidase [Peptococcaceae bacterium BRH_c4b]
MASIKVGDVVGRVSYGCDIYFKVTRVYVENGVEYSRLKGLDLRLKATAPVDDLCKIDSGQVSSFWHNCAKCNLERQKQVFKRRDMERLVRLKRATQGNHEEIESFDLPGSLVHIDGDKEYLDLCMTTYKQLNIPCHGYHVEEEKQAGALMEILVKHRPDLLVLTGHDGLIKDASNFRDINTYHNSKHFIDAVKIARTFEKNLDDLIIFAGACQSYYEGLLEAGANFASSPKRVLIHAYDPVFVMEKIAYTSIFDPIALKEIIAGTITGFDGIGGLETRGKYRLGVPKSPY